MKLFIYTKVTRAKREHFCQLCSCNIAPGVLYKKGTAFLTTGPIRVTLCSLCGEIAKDILSTAHSYYTNTIADLKLFLSDFS